MRNHQRMELVNLKEEDNYNYLNHKAIIEDATCLKHRLYLAKSDKIEPNKELVMVFSSK